MNKKDIFTYVYKKMLEAKIPSVDCIPYTFEAIMKRGRLALEKNWITKERNYKLIFVKVKDKCWIPDL